MKKILYLFVLLTHFAWSNDKISDIEIPLTEHSYMSEFNVSNTMVISSIVTETSTDSSTTSSNTCPEFNSAQPELSFPVGTQAFDFPLTELFSDADGDNLSFDIGTSNLGGNATASLSGSVVTVQFSSGIAAGDRYKLDTFASDGTC